VNVQNIIFEENAFSENTIEKSTQCLSSYSNYLFETEDNNKVSDCWQIYGIITYKVNAGIQILKTNTRFNIACNLFFINFQLLDLPPPTTV
jgi:hypothetical protein